MELRSKVRITRILSENSFIKDNPNIRGMYHSSKDTITASIDGRTGMFKTGLDGLNPEEIKELEMNLGEAPNSLSNRSAKSPFWVKWNYKIPVGGKTLDLSIPEDELAYYVLSARSNVAKNLKELETKRHSGNPILYIMTNDEEEALAKVDEFTHKADAYEKFRSMNDELMFDFLVYTGKRPYNLSPAVLKKRVGEALEQDPKKFVEVLSNKDFTDKVFINKCVDKGFMKRKGEAVYYNEEVLGNDMAQSIAYLRHPKNSSIKNALIVAMEKHDGVSHDSLEPSETVSRVGRPKKEQ